LKKQKDTKDKVTQEYIQEKLRSAVWLIKSIHQRQRTIYKVTESIVKHQLEFFEKGAAHIKPMILKDIAEIVHLDISTISRVVNSKYIQTPFGTFLLKKLFSESLSTDSGEEVSTIEVKRILQDIIEQEDKRHPLTDEKLALLLKKKKYNIARRTVAKYREQLNIPVGRLRKKL
jgi:RNA polymerase sigma-54 factor